MPNREGRVKIKNMDLVTCDYSDCPDIGEYTKCYLGLEELCNKYIKHLNEQKKDLKGGR